MAILVTKCKKCKRDKLETLVDDCPFCDQVDLCPDCLCIHFNEECDGDNDLDWGELDD